MANSTEPSSNQSATFSGEALLKVIEGDVAALLNLLEENADPFEDEKCNREFARRTRQWARIVADIADWHGDVTDCIRDGDPSVQFGGGK